MKLLLIEDEKNFAYCLKDELKKDYLIDIAFSGEEAEYKTADYTYDGVILDIGLPDTDGIQLCKKLRDNNIFIPIIMLTGEGNISKKVEALDCGADDYMVKPFHIEELSARLRVLLRRNSQKLKSNILLVGDVSLDIVTRKVTRANQDILLQKKEFQLLEYFMRNAGKLLTRDMILDHVWDSNVEALTNIVDVHIKYLRDNIDKPFHKKYIKTIYGLGYKMEIFNTERR